MSNSNTHVCGDSGRRSGRGAITQVVARSGGLPNRDTMLSFSGLGPNAEVVGKGSFGVVYSARIVETGEKVAVKRVRFEGRFQNHELRILRGLHHCNVVKLKYFFYADGEGRDGASIDLNLVFEYVPFTVHSVVRSYNAGGQRIPIIYVRLYAYQLFRALAYIRSMGICHRDVKPQNMLLDTRSSVLKLCDFGSATELVAGEPSASYICTRSYRAPELLIGSTDYTCDIDVWAAGCVLGELLLGKPMFPGSHSADVLERIIHVLGSSSNGQVRGMKSKIAYLNVPSVAALPWTDAFSITRTPPVPADAIDLVAKTLQYAPSKRLRPLQACADPFFDELRESGTRLPNGSHLPPLFNFTPHERLICPRLNSVLIPFHAAPIV